MEAEWVDPTLKKWLTEFKASTANTYSYAMKKFKEELNITDLGDYVEKTDVEQALTDFKKFCEALEERPPKTITTYTGIVRVFLAEHGLEIPRKEFRRLKRRGRLPKRTRAATRDKIPTKPQVRTLLNYSTSQGRAMITFLASTGCRIGETLLMEVTDMNLEAETPYVEIRASTTKGGESGRTVFMSYEARDAIKDWLKARIGLMKKDQTSYDQPRVFPISSNTAREMWNNACDKAGLSEKDSFTGRRLLHLHSLRKFFRTNVGLKSDYTHALMGHLEYLDDAYLRTELTNIAEAYLDNMGRVSFYGLEDRELKRSVEEMQVEIERMRETVKRFVGRTPEELQRMVDYWDQYKWDKETQESEDADYRALKAGKLELREPPTQRVVAEDELEGWLSRGWEYVSSLNNGSNKCVIKSGNR